MATPSRWIHGGRSYRTLEPSMLNPEKIALLEALDFQWKKPLSLPRKNCGVKKRKGEESEKVRRVSNGSEDSNADTAIVADDDKEEKEEANFSAKIRRLSATIDTDTVNYQVGNTDTPIVMKDVNYETGNIDTRTVTDDPKYEDDTTEGTPIVPKVAEDVKEVTNLPQQTGQNAISFENKIADTAIVPDANDRFFCC